MSKIILQSKINQDKYTDYVCEKYDLQDREVRTTEVPMIDMSELDGKDWNIGLILGNSGSGKSTILKHLGEIKEPMYDNEKSIISQFPHLKENDVTTLFTSIGLSSVPTWLSKPNELSNGEKARLDICYHIANSKENEILLIDEFTSVVNRSVAQSMSAAFGRFVRKNNFKVIIATCHYDIIHWLNPNWIFNLSKMNDGEVEIEYFQYMENKEYELNHQVNPKDVLNKNPYRF